MKLRTLSIRTTFHERAYLTSIDMLRGIAALSVVFYHFVLGNPTRFEQLPVLQSIASFGHLGVQLFFVISGFVIPYSMYLANYDLRNIGRFLLRRFARLEPPYLVSIIVCLVVAYAATLHPAYRGNTPSYSMPQLALHLAYLNTFFGYEWINVVYWTLAIEFQYYIIIALLYASLVQSSAVRVYLICGVSAVLTYIFPQKNFIFLHAPFFWCGISLFLYKTKRFGLNETVVFIFANMILVYFMQDIGYVVAGFVAVLVIVFAAAQHEIWRFLGSISYSLYLLHVPIGQRVMNVSENIIHNPYVMFVTMLLCILLMIFVSWVFFRVIEIPAHRWAKKIKY
jgi:peptidoglycan/LPS O-acetylase OafA/YrhL